MITTTHLKIGEVSRQTGVAVGALRYYESLGLITSQRGQNGYRYYAPTTVQQVEFIKKAQALGFSLEDIKEVLTVHQQGHTPCHFVQSLLQQKIDHLEAQIHQMTVFKAELEQYQDQWASHPPQTTDGEICPLIETVSLA
ncbi:heavy metal-responsive transcriptional regulator [Leptolyngbya sp. BL0902]|uniref:heavy metal-responsive transcriptional regulator n=1 Tax=Leptolyngbya sp. BL0902 TaxID=1115757 RepID=UPI0018E72075|nr:heavy metal-responsive transcriptional regulator [Leptolyngbya sp. BL0902]QQE65578.1 heavy metal-responsive transcriptional regulator [Leptolyngbya sp. BL0902]